MPHPSVQDVMHRWMLDVFGKEIYLNRTERGMRFAEEAVELVQSIGMTKEEMLKVVDYVYDRPAGKTDQEVGGVMLTLAALCNVESLNYEAEANKEMARVLDPAVTAIIKSKQAAKPQAVRGNTND